MNNRGRRGGGGGGGRGRGGGRNTYYVPVGRTSSFQPPTPGGTGGSFNSVPTDGNAVSSQSGWCTSGKLSGSNSKHCGHAGSSNHYYKQEHNIPSATINHQLMPNSPLGYLPDTLSRDSSGLKDFPPLVATLDSGDTHPSFMTSQRGRPVVQMNNVSYEDTECTPRKSIISGQSDCKSAPSVMEKPFSRGSFQKAGSNTPTDTGCGKFLSLSAQSDRGHTLSRDSSGLKDFPPLVVTLNSGDTHPGVMKSQRGRPVVELNNVSYVDTECPPYKSIIPGQSDCESRPSVKEKQSVRSSFEKAGSTPPTNSGCGKLISPSAQSDQGHNHLNVVKDQRDKPEDNLVELKNISLCETGCTPSKSFSQRDKNNISEEKEMLGQNIHDKAGSNGRPENSDCASSLIPFDICPEKAKNSIKLNAPLHVRNREKRNENKRSMEGRDIRILRPGMILLKGYISSSDQVNIVNICQKLGLGPGGFYRPRYHDRAEIHLMMMCLGMNWDPNTGNYENLRPFDGAKAPVIPDKFQKLVKSVIEESHVHLQRQLSSGENVEASLPKMVPDICIANFYSKSGRLGLHQDKDETAKSLDRGLPVVSFSVGDSAEFLYGDDRDPLTAKKVVLESGDVLLFGGKSRLVFHGVSNIIAGTAPTTLLEATNFRSPGRLNLTFRQH